MMSNDRGAMQSESEPPLNPYSDGTPSAAWAKWYRRQNPTCSLSAAVDEGKRRAAASVSREPEPPLHAAIMNLPCDPKEITRNMYAGDPDLAYKLGHRDARHAAAELVCPTGSEINPCRGRATNNSYATSDTSLGHLLTQIDTFYQDLPAPVRRAFDNLGKRA